MQKQSGNKYAYNQQNQIPMQMQEMHSDEEKQYYHPANQRQVPKMNSIIDNGEVKLTSFSNQNMRRGFIRKVMSLIGVQFLITSLLVLCAIYSESFKNFQQNNQWLLGICFLINIISLIALYCFRDVCREVPKNYILLFFFTFCESYIISFLCGIVPPGVVLLSTLLLSGIVFSLVLYAVFSDKDITMKVMFLFYAFIAAVVIIIVASAFQSHTADVIIGLVIILLFMAYLVFDIQRLTGTNQISYSLDDYIIAALDIYIDIIVIFKQLILLLISR